MRSMGATEISESTKNISEESGDLLQFVDLLNNTKLSFCSSQVAREMVTLSLQLDNRDTAPPKVKEILQIGLDIRVAILANNTEMSWPPKPCELCENAVNLPPELDVFALLSPNWTHKSQRNILIVASGVT